jgi:hypothetical protein
LAGCDGLAWLGRLGWGETIGMGGSLAWI